MGRNAGEPYKRGGVTMAKDIYDQHHAAFPQVTAYVITLNGERVATIAFKHPRDGAGRLYVYVHWLGTPMVRGWAGGYGYDKHSAACVHAMSRVKGPRGADTPEAWLNEQGRRSGVGYTAFYSALANDGGSTWDTRLRNAGFDVLQAV